MKQFLIYATLFCSFFAACNGQNSSNNGDDVDDGPKSESEKKISKRDRSITRTNSYSDLFMDSAALQNFITEKKINDTIARRMRSFYNTRNYQYAWFASNGLTEQARGFWNLHDYHTTYAHDSALHSKTLEKKMDRLIAEDSLSVSSSDKTMQTTEMALTQHFIQYMLSAYEVGYIKRKEMERFVPFKRRAALEVADSLIKKKHKDDKYFEDEILPKMNSNPGYLASQNMEIVKEDNGSGLPVIRQLPGGNNSLGNVKFLFPNSFNIYFHDTPSKSLFDKDKRAYSHGCIRLSDPTKMAEYLLRNQPEWTPGKIQEAMNSGEEKFVKVKKAVPVFITYYTAWVDENGQLNFRDDIYSHDQKLAKKMFTGNEQMAKK
jgi:murein L,D-transpeptidase YcbB/YkuD